MDARRDAPGSVRTRRRRWTPAREVRHRLRQRRPVRRAGRRHRDGPCRGGGRLRVVVAGRAHGGPGRCTGRRSYDRSGRMPGDDDSPIAGPAAVARRSWHRPPRPSDSPPDPHPATAQSGGPGQGGGDARPPLGRRMLLGVGVGWLEEEFAAIGIALRRARRRTDDRITAIRACDQARATSTAELARSPMHWPPAAGHGRCPSIGGQPESDGPAAAASVDGLFPRLAATRCWPPVAGPRHGRGRGAGPWLPSS